MRQMHDGGGSNDDFEWPEIPWSSTDSDSSSRFRLQLPEHGRRAAGKLIKVNLIFRGLLLTFLGLSALRCDGEQNFTSMDVKCVNKILGLLSYPQNEVNLFLKKVKCLVISVD